MFGKKKKEVRIENLKADHLYALEELYSEEIKNRTSSSSTRGVSDDKLTMEILYMHTDQYNSENLNNMDPFVKKTRERLEELKNLGLVDIKRKTRKPLSESDDGVIYYYTLTNEGEKIGRGLYHKNVREGIKRHFARKREGGLATRISAFIFLLAGLFLMAVPDSSPTLTGNFIGASAETDASFFIALALMILGGFLLFKSLKN